jgi:hypothetical protein
MEDIAEEAHKMQLLFEDRIRELLVERDTLAHTCEEKDQSLLTLKKDHVIEKDVIRKEYEAKIEKLIEENQILI